MNEPPLFLIQIGTLAQLNHHPACVPYQALQSVLIKHDPASQALAFELCESIALQILLKHPPQQARLLLYEAAPSGHFSLLKKYLGLLKSHAAPLGEQFFNAREFNQFLVHAHELAHRRFALLANAGAADWFAYNQDNPRPEPWIYIVLTSLSALEDAHQLEILQQLFLQGPNVGIVPIVLHDDTPPPEPAPVYYRNQAVTRFWQQVKLHAFGLDCVPTPITGINQPPELWSLLYKFGLNAGLPLPLRTEWLETLLDRQQTAAAENPETDCLQIAIGSAGGQPLCLSLGEASNTYHGMIAGTSRSGKSTLLNNLILKLCETYPPEAWRLWLFDYREGVEFQIFEGLAHIDVLHVDNGNHDYALEAFARFEGLMAERAQLFKQCQPPVSRLVDYNRAVTKPLPRCLMIIDEAQALFENRATKTAAKQMLRNLSRRGAAFGLHILLSTQSYQNVELDSDVKAQFRLRIGLQLSNSMECRALMGRDNDGPLNLPPYHAVYNNHFGELSDNRIVALDNLNREDLWQRVQALKQRYPNPQPANTPASRPSPSAQPDTAKTDEWADWDSLR